MTNQATDQRRNVLPLRVERWRPDSTRLRREQYATTLISRKTNPFVIFIALYATHCPAACYRHIYAHYKWVRFAERHVFECPSSHRTAHSSESLRSLAKADW